MNEPHSVGYTALKNVSLSSIVVLRNAPAAGSSAPEYGPSVEVATSEVLGKPDPAPPEPEGGVPPLSPPPPVPTVEEA